KDARRSDLPPPKVVTAVHHCGRSGPVTPQISMEAGREPDVPDPPGRSRQQEDTMPTTTPTRRGTAYRIALALAGVVATLAACGTAPEATPPPPPEPQASAAPLERSDVDA